MTNTVKVPEPGQIARVRQRLYLVEQTVAPPSARDSTLVRLSCVDDDNQGQPLEVLWEREIDPEILTGEAWENLANRGFDQPKLFAAYLNTLRWNCVTATEPGRFQSPFRAGIRLDAYQLEPLRKALLLPRVNLFIADDVGLGKTIEAGLIARELLLRKKVREIIVSCPPSMLLQWQDELETRFGLSFEILDKEYMKRVRRERGFGINPWSTHSRFLVSHRLLIDEDYAATLRDWLGDFRTGSLLILDEAHHAAPASGQKYAIDSQITKAIRDLAPVRASVVPVCDAAQRALQQLFGPAGNSRSSAVLPWRGGPGQAAGRSHGASTQRRFAADSNRGLSRSPGGADRHHGPSNHRPGTAEARRRRHEGSKVEPRPELPQPDGEEVHSGAHRDLVSYICPVMGKVHADHPADLRPGVFAFRIAWHSLSNRCSRGWWSDGVGGIPTCRYILNLFRKSSGIAAAS